MKRSTTFWRFLEFARPYWRPIAASIVMGVFKFSSALALPIGMGILLDYVIIPELPGDEKLRRLALVGSALMFVYVIRLPIAYARTWYAELAGNRTIFDIRQAAYAHVQRLGLSYHSRNRTGATVARIINDVNTSQGILDRGVMSVAVDLIFLGGVVVVLFVWQWELAAVSLFTLPLYAAVFGRIRAQLRTASLAVQEQMGELSGEASEKIAGLPVVQAYTRERTERRHFFQRHREYYRRIMRQAHINNLLNTWGEFLNLLGPILVLTYGTLRVVQNAVTPGELIAFYGVLGHLYLPTRRLADAFAALQNQLAAMDRVFEILDVEPEIGDAPDAKPIQVRAGRLEFEDVHFRYRPDIPVLRGVSLEVMPGQSVAIVGRSGGGKSTLVKLVPRFYDVERGAIRIDGQDIRSVTLDSLRGSIAMVMQDPILFDASVRENIRYGRITASDDEVLTAARLAHVDEFAVDLPQGYDTIVGERGITLSGGQKQRLSIARAFLRDPKILILDEATSSLDSHAEAIIQDALSHLMLGRTTLVIAHRLSTVIDCDRVVVMEQGCIVQQGRHEELVAVSGPYRALCEEQFGAVQLAELE